MDFVLGEDTAANNERIGRAFRAVSNRLEKLGMPPIGESIANFVNMYCETMGCDEDTHEPYGTATVQDVINMVLTDNAKYHSLRATMVAEKLKAYPTFDEEKEPNMLDAAVTCALALKGFLNVDADEDDVSVVDAGDGSDKPKDDVEDEEDEEDEKDEEEDEDGHDAKRAKTAD